MPQTPPSKLDVSGIYAVTRACANMYFWIAIALPSQSIGTQKDQTEPTTRRNLTLPDLVVQVKHYSPGTRKGDAGEEREGPDG